MEWSIGTETVVRHDILSFHLLFYDALLDTAISRKVVAKNVHATIPKGNMGYDQYTVPDDCSCRTYFCCFPLALANTFPWPFVPILSNFFEKKRTQNHPQCLSGLSRALFPTTFLETAVSRTYSRCHMHGPYGLRIHLKCVNYKEVLLLRPLKKCIEWKSTSPVWR